MVLTRSASKIQGDEGTARLENLAQLRCLHHDLRYFCITPLPLWTVAPLAQSPWGELDRHLL